MEEGNSYYSARQPHSLSPYSQLCVTDVNKISTTPIEVCLIISYLKDYVIIPNAYEISKVIPSRINVRPILYAVHR